MQGNAFKICPHCQAQCPINAQNCWQCMRTFQTQWIDPNQTQAFGTPGMYGIRAPKPLWRQWWAWATFLVVASCGGFTCLSLLGYSQDVFASAERSQAADARAYYLGEWVQTDARGDKHPFTFSEDGAVSEGTAYTWDGDESEVWFIVTQNGRGNVSDMVRYTVVRNGPDGFTATDKETGHVFTYERVR